MRLLIFSNLSLHTTVQTLYVCSKTRMSVEECKMAVPWWWCQHNRGSEEEQQTASSDVLLHHCYTRRLSAPTLVLDQQSAYIHLSPNHCTISKHTMNIVSKHCSCILMSICQIIRAQHEDYFTGKSEFCLFV